MHVKSSFHRQAASRIVACALAVACVGCASRTPYLDTQFGQAVQQLKAQQVMNPQGATGGNPGVGVDAQAAKSSYDVYQKSYRAPEPQPSVFIGIGGGGGGR
jgi:hypothetical protein